MRECRTACTTAQQHAWQHGRTHDRTARCPLKCNGGTLNPPIHKTPSPRIPYSRSLLSYRPAPPDPSLLPPNQPSRLVGTVGLAFDLEEASSRDGLARLKELPATACYLSNMAVDPKLRRQGTEAGCVTVLWCAVLCCAGVG